jgi:hypothetical protein
MMVCVAGRWKWLQRVACILAVGAGISAQAATVTFSDISTATGAFSGINSADDNILDIALQDFAATSTGSGLAFDTIAFVVNAEPGYYISSIRYSEHLVATLDDTSFAAATATWVVGGVSLPIGSYVFQSSGDITIASPRLLGPGVTTLPVAITNNLFAFGTDASLIKDRALVEVTTVPIPEPASVLFLLAGLGLVAWVTRRRLV